MAFRVTFEKNGDVPARLDGIFKQIGTQLRDARQRASFAMYVPEAYNQDRLAERTGKTQRKSVEPIAAAMCNEPNDCQRLQHADALPLLSAPQT